ncbi:hypothetical protein [Geodermatophilus normandii]|nr:hypothetical protein [Geodermatophilus normandii]
MIEGLPETVSGDLLLGPGRVGTSTSTGMSRGRDMPQAPISTAR